MREESTRLGRRRLTDGAMSSPGNELQRPTLSLSSPAAPWTCGDCRAKSGDCPGRASSWHDATPASLPPARTERIGGWRVHDAYPVSDVYVADPGLEVVATRGRGAVGSTQRMNAFSQP
jgi:hypothetical protein